MSEEIVWEDPPMPNTGPKGTPVWVERLSPLRDHPGKWARIADGKKRSAANNISHRLQKRMTKIPSGSWEFVYRGQPDETYAVYARYLGPEEE